MATKNDDAKWKARNIVWDAIEDIEALGSFAGKAALLRSLRNVSKLALWSKQ